MDSRSSLSMIESEDTTLLSLSQDIDHHTAQLRNDVLQSIAAIRSKIHAQTAEALDHQQAVSQATEQRLLLQIENLQDVLEVRTSELIRERVLSEKLVAMQFAQKRRQRQRGYALIALRAWHGYCSRNKALEKMTAQVTIQRRERDARSAFHGWRLQALRNKFEAALEKTITDHRRAAVKASHAHQATENASRMEVLALKEKVSLEEERRGVLEEKLKAAFMRGVCALNLEAMQVLRNTSDVNMNDVSVASLLQQMNVSGVVLPSPQPSSTAPATTANQQKALPPQSQRDDDVVASRLLQRQTELQDQIVQFQQAHPASVSQTTHAAVAATRPSTAAAPAPAPHQAFTVNVNPSYKRPGSSATPVKAPRPGVAYTTFRK